MFKRMVLALSAGLLSVAQAGGSGPFTPRLPGPPQFRAVPCPDSVSADRCGLVKVSLDHAQPTGKQIEVFVAVKGAMSTLKQDTPLFFMTGGPGGSSATDLGWLANYSVTDFDFVAVDFRGTALSKPALNCPDSSAASLLRCARTWNIPASDLNYFNSVQAAQDMESVRRALGYSRINLLGISYGTVVAQQMMRLYPASLRSVVLAGVLPTQSSSFAAALPATDDLLRRMLQSCGEQAECRQNHAGLLANFEHQWPALPASTRNAVRRYVSWLGGQSQAIAEGLTVTEQLLKKEAVHLLQPESNLEPDLSYGLNGVVNCLEQVDFAPGHLPPDLSSSRLLGYMSYSERLEVCRKLGLTTPPAELHQPVRNSVPTLLLDG